MTIHKLLSRIAMLSTAVLLSTCITTTTGGFLVDASDEQALEDYIRLAIAYFDANELGGARSHINNALAIDDRNSEIYSILALIFQREGDLVLAEENFQRSIRLDRNNARARNNYAALLFDLERYQDAYDQLERVVANTGYGGRAIAFENFGRSALLLDREEEAENAFRRALQFNRNLYVSELELALIKLNQQDWNAARANYRSYLNIVELNSVPHTPKALLAGIQIEGHFQNQKLVDDFALILTTLYQTSPEYQTYQTYQRLFNAN